MATVPSRAPRRAVFWSLLVCTAACATPITLPPEFVELRDGGAGYRAVTADDARLRVHDLSEPTEGGIEFWSETLRNELVQQRGYDAVGDGEVRDRDGVPGRWQEFAANVGGERVGYLIAIWVRQPGFPWLGGPYLQVVEYAAREPVFAARRAAVQAALATTR
jgi:hypothetical protein